MSATQYSCQGLLEDESLNGHPNNLKVKTIFRLRKSLVLLECLNFGYECYSVVKQR